MIIGHRGAAGLAPENTLAAIEAGLNNNASAIELDVRVTKDNIPVLSHDNSLTPANLGPMLISNTTLTTLQATKPDLPTLEQALYAISSRAQLILEIKPGVATAPVAAVIAAFLEKGWDASHISLASFSQTTLLAMHAALPQCPTIVNESWSSLQAVLRAKALGTKRISMNQRWLWFGFIHSMQKRGYQLNVYTLNNPNKARLWQRYGLQGVITDYPDRFRQ